MIPQILPMDLPYLAAAFLGAYLVGSIPFGLLIARALKAPDPRSVGSGNIGASNLARAAGWRGGLATLILDALKGALAVSIASQFGGLAACFAALGAAVGHSWPIWLRFRGGKAVATILGALWMLSPLAGAVFCAAWLAVALIFRISSLAALVASTAATAAVYFDGRYDIFWACALLTILLWARHHANIGRLLRGQELRITFGSRT